MEIKGTAEGNFIRIPAGHTLRLDSGGAVVADPDPTWGANTEKAGGTRYSEGKAAQTWFPWRGMSHVWAAAEKAELEPWPTTPGAAVQCAENYLRRAMNAPGGNVVALALSAWWMTVVLDRLERDGDEGEWPEAWPFFDDTLPALGTEEACRVSAYGAEKYAPFDWDLGQSFSVLLSSGMRHVKKALTYGARERDNESGLLHLGHALWNLACLLDLYVQGRAEELDDVSPWRGVSAAGKRELGWEVPRT